MSEDPSIMRPMPHALGMEKSVLSSLMKDPALVAECPLDPEIFYLPGNRIIYQAIREIGDGDLTRLVQRLHDAGDLDRAGGPAAVTEVFTYAPHAGHFDKHLAILRNRHARRMQIRACIAAVDAAYDTSEEGSGFLDAISRPITEVFDTLAAATVVRDTKALAREFLEEFEKKLAGKSLAMGIPTGIPEVDAKLRGLHPQHMGIISGRSGGGKSTLATQMGASLATAGVGVLYLILERTEQSAFQRAVIQTAGIHHAAVVDPKGWAELQGHANPDHFTLTSIRRSITSLVEANLHIRKPANRHIATQCAEIRRYHRLHGVRVVFLDQIGLVRGERFRNDSGEAELRGISNTLQELCHELGITLIVLSQVNEDGDTKGARAIEEDADWWLSIIQERDRKKENFGEHQHVLIAKDSHNGTGGERLPLVLNHETLRFVHGFPESRGDGEKAKKKNRFED